MTDNAGASGELQLIKDDEGLAVIGEASLVEAFCGSLDLTDKTPVRNLGTRLSGASGLAAVGQQYVETSGRWLKLTDESFAALKTASMTQSKTTGNFFAILRSPDGKITKNLQFLENPGKGIAGIASPAALAAAASMLNQMAMQQTIDEIKDYLDVIDRKVDDILRNQTIDIVSKMYGVGDLIDEAFIVRDSVGHVSGTTWSKVQNSASILSSTQRYALQQLSDLTDRIEAESDLGDLAKIIAEADQEIKDWLVVLARCLQLREEVDSLELDRVAETEPQNLESHRQGLQSARESRWMKVGNVLSGLLARINDASRRANSKVLLHPIPAGRVVRSGNHLSSSVVTFQEHIGLTGEHRQIRARRWLSAAGDAKDAVVDGAGTAKDAVIGGAVNAGSRLARGFRAFKDAVKEDPSAAKTGKKELESEDHRPELNAPSDDNTVADASQPTS
ncbi:MAG TPA: hypothetical protein H9870_06475 [Candidatus Corynebacterium avicola]|uniref:Uncharacterized protein n=1 Tax=Candidatus Corynebacterium avicola TaxID=2838527 RepID=A0A9D1UKP5_9CORY|nr:hypothetical protein [Candidatus Corynebacterium avicola]